MRRVSPISSRTRRGAIIALSGYYKAAARAFASELWICCDVIVCLVFFNIAFGLWSTICECYNLENGSLKMFKKIVRVEKLISKCILVLHPVGSHCDLFCGESASTKSSL